MATTAPTETCLTARDVMSAPVITASPEETLAVGWHRMLGWGVHHLVLVAGGTCTGVVDDRAVLAHWLVSLGGSEPTLADVARPVTRCVRPGTDLSVVARIMTSDRVDAVPVLDGKGELVGLVTAGDLAIAVAKFGVSASPEEAACGL